MSKRPYTPSFDYVPGALEADDAYSRPPFRVRPWPPIRSEWKTIKELRAERDELDDIPSFDKLLDRVEEVRGSGIFDEPSWRDKMLMYCSDSTLPGCGWPPRPSADDLMSSEFDDAFRDLEDEMRENDMFGDPGSCTAQRSLIEWLAENDVDVLALLIDEKWLSVCEFYFPWNFQHFYHDCNVGGDSETLLGIAARDVCSPRAVRMLLDKGANPNMELVPLPCANEVTPIDGPGGLAMADVKGHWVGSFSRPATFADKMEILTMLADAGGETFQTLDVYNRHSDFKNELSVVEKLFDKECDRHSLAARTRLENVVALVGIVSFWRRATYAPGSVAARAAIERLQNRAAAEFSI